MFTSKASYGKSRNLPGEPLASHYYPQLWFLIVSLIVFAVYVGWDLQIFQRIAALDQSYMASLIITLVVIGSVHCGWHIVQYARRISQIQAWMKQHVVSDAASVPFLQQYLADLSSDSQPSAASPPSNSNMSSSPMTMSNDSMVEIHADRMRAPVDLGWFFVDLAIRLGLLGTIIGFILIFSSLTDINISGGDDLKDLLIAMSGGMGTALLTTLSGLVGASMLSFQYLVLNRETEYLVGLLLRIRNRMWHESTVRAPGYSQGHAQ